MKRILKLASALMVVAGAAASSSAYAQFPAPYCVRGFGTIEPITKVDIDGIHNATSASVGGTANEDFTTIVGQLAPGGTYPISVQGNTDGNFASGVAVYVDWDKNNAFDVGEGYLIGTLTNSTGADGKTVSGSIAVPATAALGPTRMRIVKQYTSTSPGTLLTTPACQAGSSANYGQAEDYTVNIDPAAPVPPSLGAAFAPTNGAAGSNSTLTLTLGNTASTANALTADFTNTLPAGLVVATVPNASTTCSSGTVTTTAGSFTLATGASIPVGGCTVKVDISAAAAGIYVNSIAAGAVKTVMGDGPGASATYQATAPGFVNYAVGFEAPNYTAANVTTQQGWFASVPNDWKVTTTNPAVGTQAVRGTWTAAGSGTSLLLSPDQPAGTTTYSVASAKISLTPTGTGADFDFAPQDPVAALVVQRVKFLKGAGNKIQVLAGSPLAYVDTGATWPAGQYFDFKVIAHRTAGTAELCLNGVSIWTGASLAPSIRNLAIIGTKGTGTQNNIFDIDEVVIDNTNIGTCGGVALTQTVTPSVGAGSGTITPSVPQTVTQGGTTSFTLAPASGSFIDTVGGTCGGSLVGTTYTTAAVTADCTVIANFAVNPVVTYTVTPSVGTGTGTITPATPQTVNAGATTSFNLSAGTGFSIGTVGGTCGGTLAGSTYTTAAATANCTVIANFVAAGDPNIVCSAPINHLIVNNIDGTSVNWLTGSIVDGDIPGNDFNPYAGSGKLLFYWAATGTDAGGVAATATGPYNVLAPGAVIGSSSTFSQTANGSNNETAAFLAGVDGYLGFRFRNTGTSQINYGYVRLQTTAPNGFPATIVDYCYNNAGNAITIAGGTPVTTPTVSKAFAPASVIVGANSTATVTLTNPTATAATLTAALVDTLPAGLTASAASTTCAGGTASFTAGTFTLSTGASIPANGSCTVSATVSSAVVGSYVNTIAAGGLQTSAGANATAGSATLAVTASGPVFPAPYCSVAFASAVEPISKVTFTGITNSSSPAVNGTPALENFLSITGGSAVAGLSYPIAVEGNTDGNFTTKVNVYIDWNQNGTFESTEGTALTDLANSTGADGKQATGNIVVPVTALGGTTRMRVIKKFNTVAEPCNTTGFGQAEDYQITVTAETGSPVASVTPAAGFEFTVDAGSTGTDTMVIGNSGTATLTYNIQRALDARPAAALATKWEAQRRANEASRKEPWATPVSLGRSVAMRSDTIARPVELLAEDISQMTNNTPVSPNGISCGSETAGASNNSWWRRFYFSEHGISGPATINSVTVASESGVSTPVTVRLYTIPSSVPVDTIPTSQLTLIGTGTGTVGGNLTTTTVAISGGATVSDTAGTNLVVEYHIDAGAGLPRFFPGGNPSAQTHKSFISSADCAINEPVTTDSIGFPDFHIIMVVNVDTGAPGVGCDAPSNVPWLSVTPASGSVSPSSSANVDVTVTAGSLAPGTYEGLLCVNSNDPIRPRIEVPVSMTVEVNDTIFKDGFESGSTGSCTPAQLFQDSSFEATTGEGESNPFWASDSTTGDTVFWASGEVRTGAFGIWLGGYGGGAPETMYAEQTVTFTGSQRYLNFWRMNARQGGGVSTVKFLVDGVVVHTDSTLALPVETAFVKQTIDLSAYANGQPHTVRLQYDHNGTGADANYFLDDITLDCTAARPAK